AVGVRARHVERLDPADRAEQVPGHPGVERVRGELVRAAQQPEPRLRHHEVQVAGLRADRAVALVHLDLGGRVDLEADAAAVTAAGVGDHDAPNMRSAAAAPATAARAPRCARRRSWWASRAGAPRAADRTAPRAAAPSGWRPRTGSA